MRALVVYCHPRPESFNAAVRDVVLNHLASMGAETRLIDRFLKTTQPLKIVDPCIPNLG